MALRPRLTTGLPWLTYAELASAPGRIRTCDPRIRSPLLCPAELRAQMVEALQIGTLYVDGSIGKMPNGSSSSR